MRLLRAIWRWLVALFLAGRPKHDGDEQEHPVARPVEPDPSERTVMHSPRAEGLVAGFLFAASLCAAGFIVFYVVDPNTQLLGLSLGLAFCALAATFVIAGKRVVPQETAVEEREQLLHEDEVQEVDHLLKSGGDGLTRRRLITLAGGAAGITVGGALVVPAGSLGPNVGTIIRHTPAATPRLVPESRAPQRARIDLPGALVLALGLTAVLLPLIEGRQHGWPVWTWVSLAAAPLILGVFVAHQKRLARHGNGALLDLGLFRERTFTAGVLTQLLLASVQAAFFVYLAFYLQDGRGLNPLEAGLVFTILAVAYVVVSGPAPDLTKRFGRRVIVAGGVTLAAGLLLLAGAVADVGVGGSLFVLVPGLVLVGAGIGLCFTPLTSTVLAGVDPARAGAASGAMSAITQVGYALGVAVTGVIFFGAGNDLGHAFKLSLLEMSALAVGVVVMSRLLPRPRPAEPEPQPVPAAA